MFLQMSNFLKCPFFKMCVFKCPFIEIDHLPSIFSKKLIFKKYQNFGWSQKYPNLTSLSFFLKMKVQDEPKEQWWSGHVFAFNLDACWISRRWVLVACFETFGFAFQLTFGEQDFCFSNFWTLKIIEDCWISPRLKRTSIWSDIEKKT